MHGQLDTLKKLWTDNRTENNKKDLLIVVSSCQKLAGLSLIHDLFQELDLDPVPMQFSIQARFFN